MRVMRRRTPWWLALGPVGLILLIAMVMGIGFFGSAAAPSTEKAREDEQAATSGGCVGISTPSAAVSASGALTASLTAALSAPASPATSAPAATASLTVPSVSPSIAQQARSLASYPLSTDQVQSAQVLVAVGKDLGVTDRGVEAALVLSYTDTRLNAQYSVSEGVAVGLLKQLATDYPGVRLSDPVQAATSWYRHVVKLPTYSQTSMTPWGLARTVQGTLAGDYEPNEQWAEAMQRLLASGIPNPPSGAAAALGMTCAGGAGDGSTWDASNIISDAVMYNSAAMTANQIGVFIVAQGAPCAETNPYCLRNRLFSYPPEAASRNCAAIPGGTNVTAAVAIYEVSLACGVNPQVMLAKLQLESQGLDRANPDEGSLDFAYGWNCPDAGPGGSAACDPAHKGFINQLHGMANTFANLKVDVPAGKYQYKVGTPSTILWNVEESGCGGASVTIKNVATASLYVYTPYQPNAASIAAYPGEGDKCSSYGNRNFFFMFRKYFGSTGGGQSLPGAAAGAVVLTDGVKVAIPAGQPVSGNIVAPTAVVAKAIAAGLAYLNTPYSWGGGSATGPTLGICGPDGAENDCNIVGFDCSGLMMYVWAQVGITTPHFSQDILAAGAHIPFSQKLPGDMIGYSGHIAMYVGTWGDTDYMLEAPYSGAFLRIAPVRNPPGEPHYDYVTRVWAGATS